MNNFTKKKTVMLPDYRDILIKYTSADGFKCCVGSVWNKDTVRCIKEITSEKISAMAKGQTPDIRGKGLHSDVERWSIPFMNEVYFNCLIKLKRVPTLEEFTNYYLSQEQFFTLYETQNLIKVRFGGELHVGNLYDFRNRVQRAYPSLVRITHLITTLGNMEFFESVKYKLSWDLIDKVNLKVAHNGHLYNLYLESKGDHRNNDMGRAVHKEADNDKNKVTESNYFNINLMITQTNEDGIWLYPQQKVEKLMTLINEREKWAVEHNITQWANS